MSIQRERYEGPIAFVCDNCTEVDETHCYDFASATLKMKSHGWQARKVGEEWQHFCHDCANERQAA
jgi:hypothetical protein